MKKKGLIGKLITLIIIIGIILLITSTGFYFKLKQAKFEIGAGNVILDFDYNNSEEKETGKEINYTIEEIEINNTEENITSYENISGDENERE